ncbi:FtsB family cell division protein [Agromyces lapidis]|uniref:Septum formation initiator family protein n=1 Tax=Agromyces lapidis TaxID=279574 RepID=A0ABV5SNL7_9MICO|nr:septum formation initiator family protein [Agromyces lapidis]
MKDDSARNPRRPADPAGARTPRSRAPRNQAADASAPASSAKGAAGSKAANAKAPGEKAAKASPAKPAGTRPATAGRAKPARSPRPARSAKPAGSAVGGSTDAVRAGWLSGIRFSGFSLIMLGVLVLAVVVLAPTIAAFAQQRAQLAELRAAVAAQETEVQRLRDERERWNDETFIVTQARERLYYVMPGEVSYLVIDDRSEAAKADDAAAVSAEVTESKGDWMRTLLDSVMTAGLAPEAGEPAAPANDAPATPDAEGTR